MPRGLPDYFNPDTLVSQRLANVEEIITELRGVTNIDNRGRTLFYEKFHENLSGWFSVKAGDGAVGAISTTKSLVAPSSAYLDAGTTGGNGWTLLRKNFQLGVSARFGFETAFIYNSVAPKVRLTLLSNLDGNDYSAILQITPADGIIAIFTGGSYETVGNIGYNGTGVDRWLPCKMVCDFENALYERLIIGQEQIDVSAYSIAGTVVSAPGQVNYLLTALAANAGTNDGYFGYAAATIDEP